MTLRAYRVGYQHDMRPGERQHWRLYAFGQGHWCVCDGHAGSYESEADADAMGRVWVATGLTSLERAKKLAAAIEALAHAASLSTQQAETAEVMAA